ncbi:unnamed protein product [Ilex paraguariensis]|uniref:LOB domain-containing protein n=1 Tax=Ilex paraguariensis TaxID=185542 RepID=A0ABC8UG11_9AQUA
MSNIQRANGTQACAACKYQRRKCAPDCILAPYFPHDRQRQFLNAHKLFGVSNITKIIRNLDQPDKDEAMRTIIIQSDVRANDPVGGCYRIIRELQRLIEYNRAELDIVLHQLAICRAQTQHQQILMSDPTDHSTLNCTLDNIANADTLSSFDPLNFHHNLLQSHQEQDIVQNDHHVSLQEINSWAMQEPALSPLRVKQPTVNECEDFKQILDIPGDRHELQFELEETLQQSDEAIIKEDKASLKEVDDSFQHAQDHDLRGAATLFTLTNCSG